MLSRMFLALITLGCSSPGLIQEPDLPVTVTKVPLAQCFVAGAQSLVVEGVSRKRGDELILDGISVEGDIATGIALKEKRAFNVKSYIYQIDARFDEQGCFAYTAFLSNPNDKLDRACETRRRELIEKDRGEGTTDAERQTFEQECAKTSGKPRMIQIVQSRWDHFETGPCKSQTIAVFEDAGPWQPQAVAGFARGLSSSKDDYCVFHTEHLKGLRSGTFRPLRMVSIGEYNEIAKRAGLPEKALERAE